MIDCTGVQYSLTLLLAWSICERPCHCRNASWFYAIKTQKDKGILAFHCVSLAQGLRIGGFPFAKRHIERQEKLLVRGFGCLELCLYDNMRELVCWREERTTPPLVRVDMKRMVNLPHHLRVQLSPPAAGWTV